MNDKTNASDLPEYKTQYPDCGFLPNIFYPRKLHSPAIQRGWRLSCGYSVDDVRCLDIGFCPLPLSAEPPILEYLELVKLSKSESFSLSLYLSLSLSLSLSLYLSIYLSIYPYLISLSLSLFFSFFLSFFSHLQNCFFF